MRIVLVAALAMMLLAAGACSRPLAHARTETFQAPMPAENAARERRENPRCNVALGGLAAGVGHICNGQETEGATMAAVGAAELATGITVGLREGWDHPGAGLPLLAYSDLWAYSQFDLRLDRDRAARKRFTPQDSFSDLVAAPFNIQVMKRLDVALGILGMLAAGIGVSLAVDESIDRDAIGDDPNLFGKTVDGRIGYPVGLGIGAGFFTHVALAEEVVFRGWIQSSWARSGETRGWIGASLVFGGVHAFNIFALPREQWRDYLLIGVPFITVLGGYMGAVYRRSDYNLATGVALHFWYDFLLSATFFALDPQRSPLSARVGWQF
jgi:membrane protease YdiL (CAAX protease family)